MLDFDDILGGAPAPQHDPEPEDADDGAPVGREFRSLKTQFVHDLDRGVSIAWLAQAFTLGRKEVELKLNNCPVLRTGKGGSRLYDLRVATQYLVKPKIDVATYLESLDPKDLPERLRAAYWSARITEQKARSNARQLWHDEKVQAAFGEMFKLIKDTIRLWTDTIDESTGLSVPQREMLDNLSHDLLTQIHETVAKYCDKQKTPSQEVEFEDKGDL